MKIFVTFIIKSIEKYEKNVFVRLNFNWDNVILRLGIFDKLGGAKLLDEGRREYEQEGFFNSIFSNYYLPFIILTIYSFNIKEIHLTQQWFRWKPFLWQHSTKRNIKCSFLILCKISCYIHNNIKRTFLQVPFSFKLGPWFNVFTKNRHKSMNLSQTQLLE